VEDFYNRDDAEQAAENTSVVRIRVSHAGADDRLSTIGQRMSLGTFARLGPLLDDLHATHFRTFAARVEPLVKALNLSVVASLHPALDRWHAAQSERFAIPMKPLVRSVNFGVLASIQPATEKLRAQLELITAQAQADIVASVASAAQPWPIGVGGVVRQPVTITGSGTVVQPPRPAAPQRTDTLVCGHALAILLIWVVMVSLPAFEVTMTPRSQVFLGYEIANIGLAIALTVWVQQDRRR
jgi:hypothetical protein